MNALLANQFILALVVVGPLLFWGIWIISEESFDELNSRFAIAPHGKTSNNREPVGNQAPLRADRRFTLEDGAWLSWMPKKLSTYQAGNIGARQARRIALPLLFLVIFAAVVLMAAIISNAYDVIPKLIVPAIFGTSLVLYFKKKTKSEIDHISKVLESEIPIQIQLLTILVSSGMSPARAISQLANRSDSVSSSAFQDVVSRIEQGFSVVEALDELKSKFASNSLRRFAISLILGIERGSSLGPILTAQVRDARLARKTEIMQKAGKAEIRLMIPVVFLILPISILFALWPSYEQLGAFL